jgi:hypothetical protein
MGAVPVRGFVPEMYSWLTHIQPAAPLPENWGARAWVDQPSPKKAM